MPTARERSPSRDRRASSRPTGSPRARASSSAARRTSSTRACARPPALGGPLVIEELLEGEELSVFALCDGQPAIPLAGGAGLQAGRRRRRRARTPAAWARTRPSRAAARTRSRSSSTASTGPSLAELAARGTPVRRPPLRRADADRRRPARARVQLPLRRPGDAVDPAAARGRPARRALGGGARRPRARRALGVPTRAAVTVVVAAGDYPERRRHRLARSTGSTTPRPPARSSSTPARRSATAALVTNGGRILSVTGVGGDARRGARARLRGARS